MMNCQYEVEELENGEAALEAFMNCTKNPDHKNFIPMDKFTLNDLPLDYRDQDFFDLIKATADLTVRIGVPFVSENRPEYWPKENKKYPFSEKRNTTTSRTGTGKIYVYKYIDGCGFDGYGRNFKSPTGTKLETTNKYCPCQKCQDSGEKKNVWWEIFIFTATHLVYDEIEASKAVCRLFYDAEDSEVTLLENLSLVYANVERDVCEMKYVTCDAELGDKLYQTVQLCYDLLKKNFEGNFTSKFVFIVSHPHGSSKHVSFGRLQDNERYEELNADYDLSKLTYDTPTCPGSSGAKVYCLGLNMSGEYVHRGSLDSNLNYSSTGFCSKKC
ncbi:uncharacterized protein LOC106060345 [Biomphalaria glabrata]|uniref:Uncharacterized protein LOC106060345 n=1 Tax=Biomphalaria glabrata TaxID=6526 RepID=A0A9W2ZA07_BIOGL|nr:uncharacterized protein LOC106060345 [Biomphalaria glabrata]XP_055871849.1 uncharacterized protein LOC106060345 [Biomphalaria glabrata]XP_055871850.1 uncharacterized protein LOC106060345 [Biomphalaria glabrata]XP_055871852.1 uncharacterized protein LOC106060345 [Biomphalaria glabrata]XP_055871853.1 uncharacterized protein LOC106060345 [Biomphalaria glabrata]XP_055871854.1 uncharacterized protein LOC106060345 [Biomphalaria glabrata]